MKRSCPALREYIYVNGQQVALVDGSGTAEEAVYYVHYDHLGTPQKITDDLQETVWAADYEPFGQAEVTTEEIVYNIRFPGQYADAESGLHYNYFRDYDPSLGRYVESDPIGLNGGLNTFNYATSNPLSKIDATGLAVTGAWLETPRLNIEDYGIDDWSFVSPSFSWWGYIKFIRLHGHANGYINIDVKCKDQCNEWEVHERIEVNASGQFDAGPNLYALVVGLRAGPVGAIGANVAIGGLAALQAERQLLNRLNDSASQKIKAVMSQGPTIICVVSAL